MSSFSAVPSPVRTPTPSEQKASSRWPPATSFPVSVNGGAVITGTAEERMAVVPLPNGTAGLGLCRSIRTPIALTGRYSGHATICAAFFFQSICLFAIHMCRARIIQQVAQEHFTGSWVTSFYVTIIIIIIHLSINHSLSVRKKDSSLGDKKS